MNFTEEEIELARNTDLLQVASNLGYTPKRVGNTYTLKEIDSIRIYNQKTWNRFSNNTGGDTITFLTEFGNMNFQEAVNTLLEYNGIYKDSSLEKRKEIIKQAKQQGEYKNSMSPMSDKDTKKRYFELPRKADSNKRLYGYLTKERCLSKDTLSFFIGKKLIYEDEKHNVVFCGKDKDGVIRHANKRGTYTINGISFKGDVSGSDKRFSFNVVNKESNELLITEAPIDVMSYVELSKDYNTNLLSLNGTSLVALEQFLQDNPNIRTIKCFQDCDRAGKKSIEEVKKRYGETYNVIDLRNTNTMYKMHAKDLNEFLVHRNNPQKMQQARERRKEEINYIASFRYTERESKQLERLLVYSDFHSKQEKDNVLKDNLFCKGTLNYFNVHLKNISIEDGLLEITNDIFNKKEFEQWQSSKITKKEKKSIER